MFKDDHSYNGEDDSTTSTEVSESEHESDGEFIEEDSLEQMDEQSYTFDGISSESESFSSESSESSSSESSSSSSHLPAITSICRKTDSQKGKMRHGLALFMENFRLKRQNK
jgi:hypothetical protein